MQVNNSPRLHRFGPFELDFRTGELRKHGVKIRLQEQPLQILTMLLSRPGEAVLRGDIQQKLWPNDTVVEFDQGINAAINRLRTALGDSAEAPRYIETLARRGYRFIGAVETDENGAGEQQTESWQDLDTLAERIKRGAIPLEEALAIARQIADALEAAHEKGIVHGDLNPGNIMIKPDGSVKVLDFGLARTSEPIMDTAGYMAPEQAMGKTVDKRADIFAFGVVLYEMLQGKRLLTQEPDLRTVPVKVQRLLGRCLEKDPKKRLRDIGDVWQLLEQKPVASTQPRRAWLAWGVAALFCAGFSVLALLHFRELPSPEPDQIRFQVLAPEKTGFTSFFSLSRDGRQIAFTARGADGTHLWVRSLDSLESRSLAQTGNSAHPFWSPDNRFLAFQLDGKLQKIEVSGGPAQTLCDVPPIFYGGAWNRDGVILFGAQRAGISSVSAEGGTPTPVTALDPARQETSHALPSFLPDGRHFLYLRASSRPEVSGIYLGDLDAKPGQQSSKRLLSTSSGAFFVSSPDPSLGRVLFLRENTLMAQLFHIGRMELSGSAVPIAEGVGRTETVHGGFSAAFAGPLAYRTGGGVGYRPVWSDRQGKMLGVPAESGFYRGIALSPDGTRMAVARTNANNTDIWLVEFARGNSMRLTFDPALDTDPIWSPDGAQIVYSSDRNGTYGLYRKSASGAGEEQLLLKSDEQLVPTDWSRDGRFLLYTTTGAKTAQDAWVLPMEGDRKPIPFLMTPFREGAARFSPDGRWVAYQSDESGRTEVYVRPFPASSGGGGQWLVSNSGGIGPRWRRDGKELFFISQDRRVMAVEVNSSPSFKAGIPKPLFGVPLISTAMPIWEVSADGQRFLNHATPEGTGVAPITIVANWQAGLKK